MTYKIDIKHPQSNMYGCLPCDDCKSTYTYPRITEEPTLVIVECTDCGWTTLATIESNQ